MVRVRSIAPLVAAAALMAAAFAAAANAGCSDPGRIERTPQGYVLVGSCVAPGDIIVPEPVPAPLPLPSGTPAKS